MFFF
jgi:hypothetical protein